MIILIFIGIILAITFIAAFSLFMTAMNYREDQDWRSKREDYLNGE